MSDIVERLRNEEYVNAETVRFEAADEIEKLRRIIERGNYVYASSEIDCLRDIIEQTRMKGQTIGATVADLEHILSEINQTDD